MKSSSKHVANDALFACMNDGGYDSCNGHTLQLGTVRKCVPVHLCDHSYPQHHHNPTMLRGSSPHCEIWVKIKLERVSPVVSHVGINTTKSSWALYFTSSFIVYCVQIATCSVQLTSAKTVNTPAFLTVVLFRIWFAQRLRNSFWIWWLVYLAFLPCARGNIIGYVCRHLLHKNCQIWISRHLSNS